jgi:hypothetical protein
MELMPTKFKNYGTIKQLSRPVQFNGANGISDQDT